MTSKDFFDKRKEILYKDLLELVSWDTVKRSPNSECPYGLAIHEAIPKLLAKIQTLGFSRFYRHDDDYLWVEIGPKEAPMIGVVSHFDTVAYNESEWTVHPLGQEDDEYLYGRGIMDDKCSIVQVLHAMCYIREQQPNERIRLIIGCNEEYDCQCMQAYIANREEMPLYGFIPDAKFPYIRSEKGLINVTVEWRKDILAPNIETIHGGIGGNVIPNKATLVRKGIRRDYSGVSCHSADYFKGSNAIVKLLEDLVKDGSSMLKTWVPYMQKGTLLFSIDGEELAFNPTLMTDLGDRIQITFDSRIPIGLSAEKTLKAIMKLMDIEERQLVRRHLGDGYRYSDDHPVIQVLDDVYRDFCRAYRPDIANEKALDIAGTTYAKYFPNCVTFCPGFPGEHSYAHRENERIAKKSLIDGASIYSDALLALGNLVKEAYQS